MPNKKRTRHQKAVHSPRAAVLRPAPPHEHQNTTAPTAVSTTTTTTSTTPTTAVAAVAAAAAAAAQTVFTTSGGTVRTVKPIGGAGLATISLTETGLGSNFSPEFIDNLKCGICRTFFQDPRNLPCGHCFCHDCVARLPVSLDSDSRQVFLCPSCSMPVPTNFPLSVNILLVRLLQSFRSLLEPLASNAHQHPSSAVSPSRPHSTSPPLGAASTSTTPTSPKLVASASASAALPSDSTLPSSSTSSSEATATAATAATAATTTTTTGTAAATVGASIEDAAAVAIVASTAASSSVREQLLRRLGELTACSRHHLPCESYCDHCQTILCASCSIDQHAQHGASVIPLSQAIEKIPAEWDAVLLAHEGQSKSHSELSQGEIEKTIEQLKREFRLCSQELLALRDQSERLRVERDSIRSHMCLTDESSVDDGTAGDEQTATGGAGAGAGQLYDDVEGDNRKADSSSNPSASSSSSSAPTSPSLSPSESPQPNETATSPSLARRLATFEERAMSIGGRPSSTPLSALDRERAMSSLWFPWGVALDASRNIFVCDYNKHQVRVYSNDGALLLSFGSKGSGPGQFSRPFGLAINREGNLLVVDHDNHRLCMVSPTGNFLSKIGVYGCGEGQFNGPRAVVVDHSDGSYFVVDTGNHRVQKFNYLGDPILIVGCRGNGPGEFFFPYSIALMPGTGDFVVSDHSNHRIQIFNAQGEFVLQFGTLGKEESQLAEPCGIAVDKQGKIFVCDYLNNRVQIFTRTGDYFGKFHIPYPKDVAVDSNGHIIVSTPQGMRVFG